MRVSRLLVLVENVIFETTTTYIIHARQTYYMASGTIWYHNEIPKRNNNNKKIYGPEILPRSSETAPRTLVVGTRGLQSLYVPVKIYFKNVVFYFNSQQRNLFFSHTLLYKKNPFTFKRVTITCMDIVEMAYGLLNKVKHNSCRFFFFLSFVKPCQSVDDFDFSASLFNWSSQLTRGRPKSLCPLEHNVPAELKLIFPQSTFPVFFGCVWHLILLCPIFLVFRMRYTTLFAFWNGYEILLGIFLSKVRN